MPLTANDYFGDVYSFPPPTYSHEVVWQFWGRAAGAFLLRSEDAF